MKKPQKPAKKPSSSRPRRKAPKRIGQEQPPQFHKPDAGPYSLELVANVAMQMIASGHVRNLPGDSGLMLYTYSAQFALNFLDACQFQRLNREALRNQQMNQMLRDKELREKYPQGMPFNEALLYITGDRSEGEALPKFKRWLMEEKLADWSSYPPLLASEEAVTEFLAEARKNNYAVFASPSAGKMPEFTLDKDREKFQGWKKFIHIPKVRRTKGSGENGQ